MAGSSFDNLSPAMRQYRELKEKHAGFVLFFRMGDFYEMFWEDAILCGKVLGISLTSRSKGADAIPMAGVPFHAVEGYLRKMIAAGHRVAICEQTESAAEAKGVIKREIVRLMTPGTITDDPLLDGRSENFLAAMASGIMKTEGFRAGLAWVELSTGAIVATSGVPREIGDAVARLRPAEVLVAEQPSGQPSDLAKGLGVPGTMRPGWQFSAHHAKEMLKRQWGTRGAGGFGFADDDPALFAVAALLTYLEETQRTQPGHLRPLRRHDAGEHMGIDPASWRSLEVERTVRGGTIEGSLLSVIDLTRTAMGGRLLRQWLRFPLMDVEHIQARQQAIGAFLADDELLGSVTKALDGVCDIERVMSRIAVNRALPRDMAALARCLAGLPAMLERVSEGRDAVAPELEGMAAFCSEQAEALTRAIRPDPAAHLRDGGVIARGFDPELDRLNTIAADSTTWLAEYQRELSTQTGIPSLRVAYNKVFGYYIEVTDTHRAKIPESAGWIRKQTVKNAERYVTDKLKQFEEEALSAAERAIVLEQLLFEQVRQGLLPHMEMYQELAAGLARLDVLTGLANLARQRKYVRPEVLVGRELEIVEGRHPVLEQQLGSEFVSNDVSFGQSTSLQLITGPNMAGKSTFIRQVALLALLAQVGSYIPAKSARIGLVDRLFTRIGASDELHGGQSTFMVEMTETANLLNNATDRSLVVLDEIGRGTSTLDGLSLAWAISEHIASSIRCRTLFATHYHELTAISERFDSVKNLNVAVREWQDSVIFLHRIVEGGTDRSYGIHVARLAGVPGEILERARELMGELSVQHVSKPRISKSKRADDRGQMSLFIEPSVAMRQELATLDLDAVTPAQAHALLAEWKQKLR